MTREDHKMQPSCTNTELVLVTDIGLELGGELVSWPTRESSKSVNTGEDGAFGYPLLDGLDVNC